MSELTPTIFVVDDDDAMLDSMTWLLEGEGYQVSCFDFGERFLAAWHKDMRGCLVLDVRMAEMSGLELQERLDELGSRLPVIFVTGHGDVQMAVRAVKSGAFDFIEKPFNDQDLLERIHKAIRFDAVQRDQDLQHQQLRALFANLTVREREVLDQVVLGKSNKAIANCFGLSAKTIEVHRAKVMEKMQADSVADLVKMSMQLQMQA